MPTEIALLQRNGHYSSFQESLNDEQCFFPNASFTMRKTNSMDDISRFYRYFDLIESNSEMLITWKTYLNILQDQLRSFETLTIMGKIMARKIDDYSQPSSKQASTNKANTLKLQETSKLNGALPKKKSVVFEDRLKGGDTFILESSVDESLSGASSPEPRPEKPPSFKKTRNLQDSSKLNRRLSKKTTLIYEESEKVAGDTFIIESSAEENLSDTSDRSDISISSRARLLKSICTETKILAEKICKTVDRISRLPKKCSTCGGNMRGSRHFKQCVRNSEIIGDSFIMEPPDSKKLNKVKTQGSSMDSSYFSRTPPTPDGESPGRFRFKKFNPLKKSSMKRLTCLFVKR